MFRMQGVIANYSTKTKFKIPRVCPIIVYTGRLRPKGLPYSAFRYMLRVSISLVIVCEIVRISVIAVCEKT